MGGSQSFPRIQLNRERIYIVTGGNSGIGYETAKWLAMMGGHVVIACRSEQRANQAIEDMKKDFYEAKRKRADGVIDNDDISVEFMKLDCASFKSGLEFVEKIKSSGKKIAALICNAGILMYPKEHTEDGNEMHLQVNYLTHLLITIKLLPLLKSSGDDVRVVNVSSFVHSSMKWDFDNIQGQKDTPQSFERLLFYNNSKGYQIMNMYVMNKKLAKTNVTISCVNPGFVSTNMQTSHGDRKCVFCCLKCFAVMCARPAFGGAEPVIDASMNPAHSGVRDAYFDSCRIKQTDAKVRVAEHQDKLWTFSLERLSSVLGEDDLKELDSSSIET